MKISVIDDPAFIASLGDSSLRSTGSPRTRGVLHLSDIYSDILEKLYPAKYDRSKPMDMVRIETGLVFENVLEQGLAEKFATVRPGEIISDEGIYMSPDGVNPTLCAGEEYKATWKSCRNGLTDADGDPLPGFIGWFIQMKGYAKWLMVRRYLLRVLFVNGDYVYVPDAGLRPLFKTWDIEFTEDEIEENWTTLINHGLDMGVLCRDLADAKATAKVSTDFAKRLARGAR